MPDTFLRKLDSYRPLGEPERAALRELAARRVVEVGPREDLFREGDRSGDIHLMLDGFACRYKSLADGAQQIVAFLLPGDLCDPFGFVLARKDHHCRTLTASRVALLPREAILEIGEHYPAIARALWWSTMVDEAVLREWLLNIGRRPAAERVAHLLCELLVRLECVGLVHGGRENGEQGGDQGRYRMPISQIELAETTGLSAVHVNRVLGRLRAEGLITLDGRSLTIHDIGRLKAFGGFTPDYLHLDSRPDSRRPPAG